MPVNLKHFLFALFFSFTTAAHAMSPNEFTSIEDVSLFLTELCPIESCVVVGIGRSPTPFLAYLQSEAADYVWGIPLSDFKYGMESNTVDLDENERNALFDHFSTYLPPSQILETKSILTVDFATTGATLVAASRYIKEFFGRRNGSKIKIDMAAIVWSKEAIHPDILNIIVLPRSDRLGVSLTNQKYDCLAPFGGFNLRVDSVHRTKEVNKAYSSLVSLIELEKKRTVTLSDVQMSSSKSRIRLLIKRSK